MKNPRKCSLYPHADVQLKYYFEKSITFCLIIYQFPQQPQLEAKLLWSELLLTSSSMKPLTSSRMKTLTSSSMKTLTSSRMKPLTSSSMKTLTSSRMKPLTSSRMKPLTSLSMKTFTSSIAAVVKDEGSSLHLHFKTSLESQTNQNGFGQTPLFKNKRGKKSLKMFNFLSKFLHFLNYDGDLRFFYDQITIFFLNPLRPPIIDFYPGLCFVLLLYKQDLLFMLSSNL